MKKVKILFLTIISLGFVSDDFLEIQKKNQRVRSAYQELYDPLKISLKKLGIDINSLDMLIVGFKSEKRVDLYLKNKSDAKYTKFREYKICKSSGVLGPKRKEGDLQVPEGFYHINHFNPVSNYYLSLGINYPNESDKIKSDRSKPGGAIYLHGDCVTIGCMPLTDEKIKEIYVLACQAHSSGQAEIPVYIFPYEMNDLKNSVMNKKYKSQLALIKFWENIARGYDFFSKNQSEINYSVDSKGNYVFR